MWNNAGVILVLGLDANKIADSLFCHQKVLLENIHIIVLDNDNK
jgi:hypothetical protein